MIGLVVFMLICLISELVIIIDCRVFVFFLDGGVVWFVDCGLFGVVVCVCVVLVIEKIFVYNVVCIVNDK